MINDRHLERMQSYVQDAREKGASVVELSGEGINRAERKLPFTVVIDPREDMEVMRNEIFGPILPVKPYRTLDDVTAYINAHERPLALYIYTKQDAQADALLKQTISGGASINAAAIHATVPSLPFGGVGNSGMGHHHGFEGFLNFSHQKSVFKTGVGYNPKLLYPPFKGTMRMLDWLLK